MGAHEVPVEYRAAARRVRAIWSIDEMIPAVAAERLAEWCDVFCETGVFTPGESTAHPRSRAARRPEAAHPRRRARRERRIAGGRRGRRALGRSPDLRAAPRASPRWRRPDVVRDAAADRGVLPEARPLRAGARPDRRGRAGGARDRRQPRRRLLAVDAVRDDARLLRDGPDVRGSAGRRDHQRARGRSIAPTRSAASNRAS